MHSIPGPSSERCNARRTVTIAARAAHIAKGDADRRVGTALPHRQIKVDDGPASVTAHDEPMVFGRERGSDGGPEPHDVARCKGVSWMPGRWPAHSPSPQRRIPRALADHAYHQAGD